MYSLIPIYGLMGRASKTVSNADWMSIAVLEASFFVNTFVLFYFAAIIATENAKPRRSQEAKALTAVDMPPALMEGLESGICFTCMILWPASIAVISWTMAVGVFVSIVQRAWWMIRVLRIIDEGNVGEGVKANVDVEGEIKGR